MQYTRLLCIIVFALIKIIFALLSPKIKSQTTKLLYVPPRVFMCFSGEERIFTTPSSGSVFMFTVRRLSQFMYIVLIFLSRSVKEGPLAPLTRKFTRGYPVFSNTELCLDFKQMLFALELYLERLFFGQSEIYILSASSSLANIWFLVA